MTYEETLRALAENDPSIMVLTAENRAAIRNLPAVLGPRFIDVGICEQTMIGAAAGLALRGRTPICHALAAFLVYRAYEFIRTDVGIARLGVKLVGGVPGFLSEANGPTHQAIEDVALMRGIPGMKIFCPSDEVDLVAALPAIVADPSPWYIRFCALEARVEHPAPFVPGVAEVHGDGPGGGQDVAILTYGMLVREAVDAMNLLRARGVGARVIHLRTLEPVDEAAILDALRTSALVVTLEDHLIRGGLYTLVAELCLARRATGRVVPIALQTWFRPTRLRDVLEVEGFAAAGIAARIEAALRATDG